jgi:hypothetical protein
MPLEIANVRRVKAAALILLALASLGLCGCPILMIPGLAYSGYQYEKTGKLPGMPSTPAASESEKNKQSSQSGNSSVE